MPRLPSASWPSSRGVSGKCLVVEMDAVRPVRISLDDGDDVRFRRRHTRNFAGSRTGVHDYLNGRSGRRVVDAAQCCLDLQDHREVNRFHRLERKNLRVNDATGTPEGIGLPKPGFLSRESLPTTA